MFYICSSCEYGSATWMGRCSQCGEWNTFVKKQEVSSSSKKITETLQITPFTKIKTLNKERIKTGIFEFDRVCGGGFVPGEIILLTGEPGVGKSTLLLQSLQHLSTLYISGEEAAEQIRHRAERLAIGIEHFLFSNTLQTDAIVQGIEDLKNKPQVVVIDSIQTIYSKIIESPPGSVLQLKESTMQLIALSKTLHIPILLVGHITKGGEIAGPKTLEHLVDCVLTFEGERLSHFRVLRASKNRFGSTDEIGIFEMKEKGLEEVSNPLIFLNQDTKQAAGCAITGVTEGKRCLFFEIQTLAVPTMLAIPRRVVKGVDYNKVLLLLAVIRKHLNIPLDTLDIYVSVAGGIEIKSPLADLALIASLISSIKNIPIPKGTIFIGETGLLGEVRKSFYEDRVIQEAQRLKFKNIFSPKNITTIKNLTPLFTR